MGKYKRLDPSERTMLASSRDFFSILGQELGKPDEFQMYREKFDRAAKGEYVQDYPLHIDFELNYICNLECVYCVFALPPEQVALHGDKRKRITFDDYTKIIDDGVSRGLCSVGFNGYNEPLTVKELPRFISYARDKGVLDIMFNTNGVLLDEKKSLELLESGLTRLMVSVDAFKADTYKNYRVGGDLDVVRENILRFLELRNSRGQAVPLVRLSYVVHNNNVDELEDFLTFWKDKVDFFSLQKLMNVSVFPEERSQQLREECGTSEVISEQFVCGQPYQRVVVRHNGDVSPCCASGGLRMTVGNIHKETIQDIWSGKRMTWVRDTVNDFDRQSEVCRRCREESLVNIDLKRFQAMT